ncbi:unnamed protein product [Mycena citricolor]|uniref:Cytochrome P450 n=1 Tax=Mycena citricolor TaxID=2018698 RepID=A0AAD2HF76_9AGAR|nr:unnamed protein product [Mycena citricolor]CAK5274567.1 unnamed protein product [Mycena citricolor]
MGVTMYPLLQAAISLLLVGVYFFSRQTGKSIPDLPGPKSSSWLYGNLVELLLAPVYGQYEFAWLKQFGSVYRIRACFGRTQIVLGDPVAMHHVFNSPNYDHALPLATYMRMVFGMDSVESVRAAGPQHRHLRTALNGVFTASVVQSYEAIFERVAEGISEQIDSSPTKILDFAEILSAATLSAISLGFFKDTCRSVEELDPEFVELNTHLLRTAARSSKGDLLSSDFTSNYLPRRLVDWLLSFRVGTMDAVNRGRDLGLALGRTLVEDKLRAQASSENQVTDDVYDLLLWGKAGTATKKLSTEELIAQTSILLVAGQDTTANTLVFCLIALARDPSLQDKLRAEILARLPGQPYNQLPLLNAVIKEALRMFPAEPLTDRLAYADDVIPLSEPILDRHGRKIDSIHVRKGQVVTMAIASYQRVASRWGQDAMEFNPMRWLEGGSVQTSDIIGPYANLMSFISGARTCVGWRFAVMEMQIILCELVSKFKFTIPPGKETVVRVAQTLIPINDKTGEKCAMLQVESI